MEGYDSVPKLEKLMAKLFKDYGNFKIILVNDQGDSEGIWVTPVSQADLDAIKANEVGKLAFVRLMRRPLSWDFYWGSLIAIRTAGVHRPSALLEDQKSDEVRQDKSHMQEVLVAFRRKEDEEAKKPKPKKRSCVTVRKRHRQDHG